jgi:hypothetical protein
MQVAMCYRCLKEDDGVLPSDQYLYLNGLNDHLCLFDGR